MILVRVVVVVHIEMKITNTALNNIQGLVIVIVRPSSEFGMCIERVTDWKTTTLSTETIKGAAGTLESIDHIKGSDSFTSFFVSIQVSEYKEARAHRLACSV